MNLRKIILPLVAAAVFSTGLYAQSTKEDFLRRYNLLYDKFGPAGVGIETLVGKWEQQFPEDPEMLAAKFSFYLAKSVSSNVIILSQDKYLGRDPIFAGKDSLGNKKNYFEDNVWDDALFAEALSAVDKAIRLCPRRLDYRIARINALTGYEKESPDMAVSGIRDLIDIWEVSRDGWEYPGVAKVDDEVFKSLIQDFCFVFFKEATPVSREAFLSLSERMLRLYPNEPMFMDNVGSYYLVCKRQPKKALKYYDKVLKKHPDDDTAIKNSILAARSMKNVKLEKKYQAMMSAAAAKE